MPLKVVTQPTTEPLTTEEAKRYLRAEGEDNLTISSLIKQAREYCEDYQGKKFITQTLEFVIDSFPAEFEFRDCSPVQSITSIKYMSSAGVETTISATDYILDAESFVNRVVLAYGKSWPSVTLQPVNGVRVRFVAGYGSSAAVPESVKWAMVLHMRLLYDDYKPDERTKIEKARDALLGMRRVVPV
jgi:uncharacterized phiE125 gp8 family phage protein